MNLLPVIRFNGTNFFMDRRLREFRHVKSPHSRITFEEFTAMIFESLANEFYRLNSEESAREGQVTAVNFDFFNWAVD